LPPASAAGAGADSARAGGETSAPAAAAEPLAVFSTLPLEDAEFREIVQEFVDVLQPRIASMQEAFEKRDLGELARLAHWLKGAGGTAGFAVLTEPARRLEASVRDQQCDAIEAAVAELMSLAKRIAMPPPAVTAAGRNWPRP
jgi:HPt (histidine-containing phosphotransfer) domain-containing protein